jgi:hypothetical protein
MRPPLSTSTSTLALAAFVILAGAPLHAQPTAPPAHAPAQPRPPAEGHPEAATEPEDEAEEEAEPRNEIALILAGTREREERATSLTIGAEYERRLGRKWGVITEFEYVRGPGSWVFAMPLSFRPVGGGFELFIGPGLERRAIHEEHGEHGEASSPGDAGYESLFLWRMGTGYTWEFHERYAFGPSFYVDAIREGPGEWGSAFVFGVSLGIAF